MNGDLNDEMKILLWLENKYICDHMGCTSVATVALLNPTEHDMFFCDVHNMLMAEDN